MKQKGNFKCFLSLPDGLNVSSARIRSLYRLCIDSGKFGYAGTWADRVTAAVKLARANILAFHLEPAKSRTKTLKHNTFQSFLACFSDKCSIFKP
jgi:hypothetical protein